MQVPTVLQVQKDTYTSGFSADRWQFNDNLVCHECQSQQIVVLPKLCKTEASPGIYTGNVDEGPNTLSNLFLMAEQGGSL